MSGDNKDSLTLKWHKLELNGSVHAQLLCGLELDEVYKTIYKILLGKQSDV